jgi:hypothetical protein
MGTAFFVSAVHAGPPTPALITVAAANPMNLRLVAILYLVAFNVTRVPETTKWILRLQEAV